MLSSARGKGSSKQDTAKDKGDNLKQLTLRQAPSSPADANNMRDSESKILAELEKMRKDNQEGHTLTQLSLTRLDTSICELMGDLTELQLRTNEA